MLDETPGSEYVWVTAMVEACAPTDPNATRTAASIAARPTFAETEDAQARFTSFDISPHCAVARGARNTAPRLSLSQTPSHFGSIGDRSNLLMKRALRGPGGLE